MRPFVLPDFTPNGNDMLPLQAIGALPAGYGKILFQAGSNGKLTHLQSITTVQPHKGETQEAFIERVKTLLQPGDDVELACEAGAVKVVRITRPATTPA